MKIKNAVIALFAIFCTNVSFGQSQLPLGGVYGELFGSVTTAEAMHFFWTENKYLVSEGGPFESIKEDKEALITEYRKLRALDRKYRLINSLQEALKNLTCTKNCDAKLMSVDKNLNEIEISSRYGNMSHLPEDYIKKLILESKSIK